MLPAGLIAKAMQLCAAALAPNGVPASNQFAIAVQVGPALMRQPENGADAEATVRELISLGADFEAGPLAIRGMDFASFGVTPHSAFDACALAHLLSEAPEMPVARSATVSNVVALLRNGFGARITDTIRPMSATYGARYSWHKFGQAVDFVPAGGVDAVDRNQIRSLMAAHGVRLIELLGPGDRGHATHWHIAFARPGQLIDRIHPVEGDEDWVVTVASTGARLPASETEGASAPASAVRGTAKTPPAWDVFALAAFHTAPGGGS